MRAPRMITLTAFAAMLPQLTGCYHLHPVTVWSLPTKREDAGDSEELSVRVRDRTPVKVSGAWTQGRSKWKVSGAWRQADTLMGVAKYATRETPIMIPVQDIKSIGHAEFSEVRTTLLVVGFVALIGSIVYFALNPPGFPFGEWEWR